MSFAPQIALVATLMFPNTGLSDARTDAFVEANVLATLYHELGHALIDIEAIPIFGQEEDAADVLSILLIDSFFEEDDAVALVYDTAYGFLGEAERAREEGFATAFWDVHGPDEQRYYNTICLFYGADPEERDDVAAELGLPEERAEYCPDEFDQANESWGTILDRLAVAAPGDSISMGVIDEAYRDVGDLLAWEVELLNEDFVLSADLVVSLESCGEANAFYDVDATEIIICTEYVDDLANLAPK